MEQPITPPPITIASVPSVVMAYSSLYGSVSGSVGAMPSMR